MASQPAHSCLYACRVLHHRFSPRTHRFAYRLFMLAVDLDELPQLDRQLRLFSVNRPNLFSFRESDYFPSHESLHSPDTPTPAPTAPALPSLKARVLDHLARQGTHLPDGRVVLVALPRMLGYLFNPVAFYFCFDSTGTPRAAIAEVTNTFREVKLYTLDASCRDGTTFRLRIPKHFYVSPFSDVDVAFDFQLRVPGEKLSVQIDDFVGPDRTLTSTLHGPRRELSDLRLAGYLFKYPLLTLRVIALIHWHALRLWLKRIPWFRKSARPLAQRDLYRPHSSLAPPTV